MRQARFEIRDGEKEERRTISNPVSSIILEIRAPSGGGGRGEDIERAFFFFLTFYSAGKIEGGGGDEGCACFAGRRTAEIRNPVPLVIFRKMLARRISPGSH